MFFRILASAASLALLGLVATGCAADTGDPSEDVDVESDALSKGYAAASTFNKSGLTHADNAAGIMVSHTRDNKPITTYDASHARLGDVSIGQGPRGGHIRIQTLERIENDGQPMFRVWAGASSNDGWVELSDVAPEASVHEETAARHGNGESCESKGVPFLTGEGGKPVEYRVQPELIQDAAKDKRWKIFSKRNNAWYKFSGDWDKLGDSPSRVALMWSWTRTGDDGLYEDFSGGGVVRTEMREGGIFNPCKVVPVRSVLREAAETKGSVPDLKHARSLTVYAAYGAFRSAGRAFYGWTILAERLRETGACKMHVSCVGDAAPCPNLPLPKDCKL